MGAIWEGTMSLLPKSLLKIGSDLGRHHIILPTQIAPMGAIWVGSDFGTYNALCMKENKSSHPSMIAQYLVNLQFLRILRIL